MDAAKVGKYKELDVYLIQEGSDWYIAFDTISERFWLKAINNIVKTKPEYSFSLHSGVEVVISELAELLARINKLVEVL